MCLAVPGKILTLTEGNLLERCGRVSFEGVIRDVNLACVPEAKVGEYVLVHAGVAIGRIDAEAAGETLRLLRQFLDPEPEGTR